jgi:hypothetical protein
MKKCPHSDVCDLIGCMSDMLVEHTYDCKHDIGELEDDSLPEERELIREYSGVLGQPRKLRRSHGRRISDGVQAKVLGAVSDRL